MEHSKFAGDKTGRIIAEFTETIETLDNKEIVDKGILLGMLYSLTSTMSSMDQLSEFLVVEIERYKSVEARGKK
jgi:hypothetical protein